MNGGERFSALEAKLMIKYAKRVTIFEMGNDFANRCTNEHILRIRYPELIFLNKRMK